MCENENNRLIKRQEYLKQLCGIIAGLLSDGGLCYVKSGRSYRLHFASKDIYSATRFINDIESLFAKKCSTVVTENRLCKVAVYSKELFFYFAHLGLPIGAKSNLSYSLPQIVKSADSESKAEFLRRFFDAEASIRNRRNRWGITISQQKREDIIDSGIKFMTEIAEMLKEFGIDTTRIWVENSYNVRVDGTKTRRIAFSISNLLSIIRFAEKIGFYNEKKRTILEEIVSTTNIQFPTEKVKRQGQTVLIKRDKRGRFCKVIKPLA